MGRSDWLSQLAGAPLRDTRTYFRYLWQFNAVVIAILGLVAVTALLSLFFRSLFDAPPRPSASDYAQVGAAHGFVFRLARDAVALPGTHERLFVLERWRGDPGAPNASGNDVNLLVVDGDDASSHWMFPANDQTILSRDVLHADAGAYSPASGMVLTVLDHDVGDDGSRRNREALYCYRVGGGQAVRFFIADTIMAAQQAGPDRYLVIYRNGKSATAELFSLVDFHSIAKRPLPDVP